ncbi:MAG: YqzM family protein [Bacillota bacterium]|nr:YqzM family protein [Bacillota bacterium]
MANRTKKRVENDFVDAVVGFLVSFGVFALIAILFTIFGPK